jgi:hypothetical protein
MERRSRGEQRRLPNVALSLRLPDEGVTVTEANN